MFGIFSRKKKIPATDQERVALVRRLMRLRFQHCPNVAVFMDAIGTSVDDLDDLDDMIVMGMPEASIMRIVEQYTTGREQGAPDEVLVPFLNQSHAIALSQEGQTLPELRPPYSLERYVGHFLEHIHPQGFKVSASFISIGVREVRAFYGR